MKLKSVMAFCSQRGRKPTQLQEQGSWCSSPTRASLQMRAQGTTTKKSKQQKKEPMPCSSYWRITRTSKLMEMKLKDDK